MVISIRYMSELDFRMESTFLKFKKSVVVVVVFK